MREGPLGAPRGTEGDVVDSKNRRERATTWAGASAGVLKMEPKSGGLYWTARSRKDRGGATPPQRHGRWGSQCNHHLISRRAVASHPPERSKDGLGWSGREQSRTSGRGSGGGAPGRPRAGYAQRTGSLIPPCSPGLVGGKQCGSEDSLASGRTGENNPGVAPMVGPGPGFFSRRTRGSPIRLLGRRIGGEA